MAFKWVSKVRRLLPGSSSPEQDEPEEVREAVAELRNSASKPPAPKEEPSVNHPPPWMTMFIQQIPTSMLVIGLLLSACAQLISVWAFLGFLLVAASPIVYWLRRVEKKLDELIEVTRKRSDRR